MKFISNGLNDIIPNLWIWKFLITKDWNGYDTEDGIVISSLNSSWNVGYYPDYENRKFEFEFFFAWYDLWIGAFYNQKDKTLFICPLPCVVFKFFL